MEATKIIHEAYPEIHVLMLTTFDDDDYVVEALNHGAAGYVLKDIPPNDLIVSLRAVCNGSIIISPQVANKLLRIREGRGRPERAPRRGAVPSPKARSCATSASGRSRSFASSGRAPTTSLIARKLCIAEQTVKNHVSVIYSKLHVHNRMQAMKLANSLKDYFELDDEKVLVHKVRTSVPG